MNLFALTPMQLAAGQIALAAVLAVAGFALLLPRPRGRFVAVGVAALIAAAAVFGAFLYRTYGNPMPDAIGSGLFWVFSAGALGFGTVLVVQRNPARGAIAFAFVILSTCGLFLLLAAPFLMAATVIIYAGAIVVTFLFVLMLSQTSGASDENDRSREPWFGGLAGFAFTGLVLFTLYLTQTGAAPAQAGEEPRDLQRLPAPVLTAEERRAVVAAVAKLDAGDELLKGDTTPPADWTRVEEYFDEIESGLAPVVGSRRLSLDGSIRGRLEVLPRGPGEKLAPLRGDEQAKAVLARVAVARDLNEAAPKTVTNHLRDGKPGRAETKAELRKLRDELVLLAGAADLPARNVGNVGYLLYTDHLLAVELAGTLLLVATIGAISIAHRKGTVA